MTDEQSEYVSESDMVKETQAGAEELLKKAEDEQNKSIEEKAAKLADDRIKSLDVFATKQDLENFRTEITNEIKAFKAFLLKAKAQGKATIRAENENADKELEEIYKDTGLFPRK